MKPCEECMYLVTKNKNQCETYLAYLKIGLVQNDIKDICDYIQKNHTQANIKNLCKLISK